MGFSSIGDSIGDAVTDKGNLQQQVDAAQVLELATEVLAEIFGPEQSQNAKPLYLKNRTLTITCGSSAIAQEIRLNQGPIVEKINKKLGKKEVDRLRYLA